MFLGYYDPDKKKPARDKVIDALDRYNEKFPDAAVTCLTSVPEAEELNADDMAPDLIIKGIHYIPRYTFYVGIEEPVTA